MLDYAVSLLAPWAATNPCLPVPPIIPAQRLKLWARGSLQCSTVTNFGFLLLGTNVANNEGVTTAHPVLFTSSTYTGVTLVDDAATTGVNSINFNSPFAVNDFGTTGISLAVRIVSWGGRVRYTGTELNRGGTIYCLEEPNHSDLDNYNIEQMLKYQRCQAQQVDREWHSVTYQPVLPREFEYSIDKYANHEHFHPMAIAIQCPEGTAGVFEFEVFMNVEAIGNITTARQPGMAARGMTERVISALSSVSSAVLDTMLKRTNPVAVVRYLLNNPPQSFVAPRQSRMIEL